MRNLTKLKKLVAAKKKGGAPKKSAKVIDTTPVLEPMSVFARGEPIPALTTSIAIPGPWPNRKFATSAEWNTGITVVGLDPSLNGFGVCQLNERMQVYRSETWDDVKNMRGRERISVLVKRLRNLVINLCGTREVFFVREDYAYSQNDNADTPLKELGGVIRWEVEAYAPLYTLPITSIKKFFFGKGNAKKEEMMKEAYKLYGFDGDQNQVDAMAVSLFTLCILRRDTVTGLSKPQREAIDALVALGHPLTTIS